MDPVTNPYAPGAGTPPPELAGRDELREQVRVAIERVRRGLPAKSILIEIGSEDPTVDMRQGVLLYNYARRAGKHAVMLNYPGEGHGLAKKENQLDYHRRIQQWFGHYLKGEPAPAWITEGQKALDRRAILDANKDSTPGKP